MQNCRWLLVGVRLTGGYWKHLMAFANLLSRIRTTIDEELMLSTYNIVKNLHP